MESESWLILLFSLLSSAFFSGIEIAFISSNQLKIELFRQDGGWRGKVLNYFVKNPSKFISTTLVGNNVALVVFGIYFSQITEIPLSKYLEIGSPLMLIAQTILSTIVVLFIGEYMPKLLFRINPNNKLILFTYLIGFFFILFYPFVLIVEYFSIFIIRYGFRIPMRASTRVFNKLDLEHFVKEGNFQEEDDQELDTDLFENALYLAKEKARDCMVPRPEIEGIEIDGTVEEARKRFSQTKLSRLLVFRENIDNVLGYIHHHSILKQPSSIAEILFPIPLVPETMPAHDVMNIMLKEKKSISLVVDEYGGTAGVITLEDIVEEIVGEIQDEHDVDDQSAAVLELGKKWRFNGRTEIAFINEEFELDLPEGEYQTIAGLIMEVAGGLPEVGEVVETDMYNFTVNRRSKNKLESVIVEKVY